MRGEGAQGEPGVPGPKGERGHVGVSTYNGPLDFVFRNGLPIAAIIVVILGFFTLHTNIAQVRKHECQQRAITRATQRTQIEQSITTGKLFRDNSKSPVIRAYFKAAVPKREQLLRAAPPINC